MVELKERANGLLAAWGVLESELNQVGPEAIRAARSVAAARFAEVGIPTVKHEEWKYTSLRPLAESTFSVAPRVALTERDLSGSPGAGFTGLRLAFVNGFVEPKLSRLEPLPNGLKLLPLREALEREDPDAVRNLGRVATLEGKLGAFNDERFVWLNTAYLRDGAIVVVPSGREVEPLIHLAFYAAGDEPFCNHPRVLIALEEGARARIVESYVGLKGSCFTNPVTEVVLARGAWLEHTRLQFEASDSFHIGVLAVEQHASSNYVSNVVSFGARVGRLDLWAHVAGERAETSLNGVYVGRGDQVLDHHTRIDHAVPNCHSFEVYKGILAERATGVFNGKIFVYPGAQKTDAKQTNQALLLSRSAAINTKPQLEIFADDVKCTHGATVGQLREDAMFYLRCRGIPELEARDMLVYAFAAEVLEQIGDEPVRIETERLLYESLPSAEEE